MTIVYAVAITYWLWRGTIFAPIRCHGPRLWRALWACPLCLGTWVGWACMQCAHYEPWALQFVGTGALVGTASLVLGSHYPKHQP